MPTRYTLERWTAKKCTPIRYTPIRCTPMRCTPMRCMPHKEYAPIPLGGKCDPSPPLTEGTRLIPPNYLGTLGALRELPIKNKCLPISAHKLSGESHLPPNGMRHKLMRCTVRL